MVLVQLDSLETKVRLDSQERKDRLVLQELQGHLGHQVKLEARETLERPVHRVQLVQLAVREQ